MMKTAIIVDSTAYLNEDLTQHPHIYQVDLSVVFEDGTVFSDSAKIQEQASFYEYSQKIPHLPKSSQPQPGKYYALVDQLIDQGYDSVIAIHLSSGISGTFALAQSILSEYEDQVTAFLIDSKSSCIVMEALVRHALQGLQEGQDLHQLAADLTWRADHTQTYLMVEQLDNLVKGGRLNPAFATIGQLLQMRPILWFNEEGKIVLFEKIRTNKKVYHRWLELYKECQLVYPDGVDILITHGNVSQECQKLIQFLQKELGPQEFLVNTIGPVIGTHTGEGCIGFALMPR